MPTLPQYAQRLPCIRQQGLYWCIPAGVENLLLYEGVTGITQEALVYWHCSQNPEEALQDASGQSVPLAKKGDRDAVLVQARSLAFRDGNFLTFKAAAMAQVGFPSGHKLVCREGLDTSEKYLAAVAEVLCAGHPTLVSVQSCGGWHIMLVVAIENGMLTYYDPGRDEVGGSALSAFQYAGDILSYE